MTKRAFALTLAGATPVLTFFCLVFFMPAQTGKLPYLAKCYWAPFFWEKRQTTEFLAWPNEYTGLWRDYYSNGTLAAEIFLTKGEISEGERRHWDRNGELTEEWISRKGPLSDQDKKAVEVDFPTIDPWNSLISNVKFYKNGVIESTAMYIDNMPWSGVIPSYYDVKSGSFGTAKFENGQLVRFH